MDAGALHQRIESRLRDEVCAKCIYRTSAAGCGLPEAVPCPILSRIEPIVQVVRSVSSDRLEPYVDRLREVICHDCPMEDSSGQCRMRDKADCALDDYFGLIVSIVEEELASVAQSA